MLKNKTHYLSFNKLFIFIKNENGAILLSFIFILPIFIGLIFLSFEISHFIQKKARLSDAIEQATLALTVDNDESPDDDNIKKEKNSKFIINYAKAYLPNEKFSNPVINITSHSDYINYQVDMTIYYPTKILNKIFQTVSPEVSISDNARALKYTTTDSKPTDVVFVADYSGSMNEYFDESDESDESDEKKIVALRRIFKDIQNEIKYNNVNIDIIGFVPFSWGTKNFYSRTLANMEKESFCHFPFVPNQFSPSSDYLAKYNFSEKYNISDLKKFPELNDLDIVDSIKNGECTYNNYRKIINEINDKLHYEVDLDESYVNEIYDSLDLACNMAYFDEIADIVESNIDYTKTLESINKADNTINIKMVDMPNNSICLRGSKAFTFDRHNRNNTSISKILGTRATGGTLISSGILTGNNIFLETDNSHNKLMIIISDGDDSRQTDKEKRYYNISKNLIKDGMCEKIKGNGIKMAFIAIGYVPREDIDWRRCVGEENFYFAKNAHELELDIRQALVGVDSEVGRNIPKK
ncbi:putative fimbrial anchor [Yersinia frederiksenii]|uniref:TadE/TadG family type IV pilus assembly protein n=1 Tax=Yersinia frederiksenii TaxID=29484 RepID=UPI0005E436AC|nr:TadE/TadG family type IV pilus assembly protein [Yersinia frederiksenii]CNC50409.1 putative fimbrial anchor [Yersinia frederiksenii]